MTTKNKSKNCLMTSYDVFIAKKIQEFRLLERYFIKHISQKTKIKERTLSSYERCESRIPASHLFRIAKALDKDYMQVYVHDNYGSTKALENVLCFLEDNGVKIK
jgi:hypothetical protein